MAIIEVNWNPNKKELNIFITAIALVLLVLISMLCVFKKLDIKWCVLFYCLAATIFIISVIFNKIAKIIYRIFVTAGLPLGYIISFVLMGLFYFLIITCFSIVFRIIGRDPLYRNFDLNMDSYWSPHESTDDTKRYFSQF